MPRKNPEPIRQPALEVRLPPLHDKQRQVLQHPARYKVVVCGRQWGKALGLDTPIPTPNGWTTMGALRVGDEVFDEAGAPTEVTFTSEVQSGRTCYEVIFDDGSTIVADAEHQWLTHSRKARKAASDPRRHTEPAVVTTEQIRRTLRDGRETNHAVPVAMPLEYPERKVPIDPYVLGIWLGDGSSRAAQVACADADSAIMDEVERRGYMVRRTNREGRTPSWRIYDIQSDLRMMGILGHKAIPNAYLHGSVEQREELLKGLMDTDGGVEEGRLCSIASSYPDLANDIEELIVGLGYRVSRRVKKTSRRDSHRFVFFPWRPVFRLDRKLRAQMRCPPGRKRFFRYVTDVREVPRIPVRCIQVAAASSLYLAGRTCIPTHNTTLGAVMCVAEALKGGEVWWIGPTFPVAIHGWRTVMELANQIPGVKIEGRPMPGVQFPGGGRIEMHSSNDPHSLRGATLNGVVFDEAAFAVPEAWQYLQPTLAIRDGWAVFISTPKGTNWFHRLYEEADSLEGWMRWRLPSVTSPWFPPGEIERAKETMTAQKLSQEYGAEFVSSTSMFRPEWIQHYFVRSEGEGKLYRLGEQAVPDSECRKFHTVDLAWTQAEGADYTVISSWAVTKQKHLLLLDVIRGRFEGPEIIPRLRLAYERYPGQILIEKASKGLPIIQDAVRSGLPVRELSVSKGGLRGEDAKVARAAIAMARMEQRTVWFPERSTPWFHEVEEELLAFPDGNHDDFVDTLSYAAIEVAKGSAYDDHDVRFV